VRPDASFLPCFFALTPSPSPTLWERGVGAHGGAPCSAFPSPAPREKGTQLIRVHRLSSLGTGLARFFALTPSPSPTAWERGVGAHGGAP